MKQFAKRILLFGLLVVPVVMMSLAGVAQAAGPMWMPGFPLRAGAAVIIMWTPVPGATEYRLFKKMGSEDFKEVYKGPVNTYNDADAPVTKTIEYKVVGVAGGKDTDFSPIAALKGVEPLKPPAFTGVIPAADAITLRWSNPVGSVFFNLYRSEKKDGPYDLLGSFQQEIYTDRKIDKTKTYFYRVTAVDKNNTESEKSAVQDAKTVEVAKVSDMKILVKKPIPKGTFAGEDLYEFEAPAWMTLLDNGELAVLDRNSIQFVDKDGKFLHRINLDPKWSHPSAIVPDKDGNFLLVFYAEAMVRKVGADGKVIQEITYTEDPQKRSVNNPNFVAQDKEGNYWISDGKRFQLIQLDPSGKKELAVLGRMTGTFNAQTIVPEDMPGVGILYCNPYDGNLYAILAMNAQIKVFDPKTKKLVKVLGGVGGQLDQFQGIGGLYFKKDGGMFVFDSQMQVLKEFDKDFKYLASYADVEQKGMFKLSTNLASSFVFNEKAGRFYILSAMGNKVYIYDMPK